MVRRGGINAAHHACLYYEIRDLLSLDQRGMLVEASASDVIPLSTADPDDDWIIACAVKGMSTHIVTYDPHFAVLGETHRGIQIMRPLNFLHAVRGAAAPER